MSRLEQSSIAHRADICTYCIAGAGGDSEEDEGKNHAHSGTFRARVKRRPVQYQDHNAIIKVDNPSCIFGLNKGYLKIS